MSTIWEVDGGAYARDLELALGTESIERLDEAWDIACEYRGGEDRPPCGAHADWWLICNSCGASIAECNPHRVEQHRLWMSAPGFVCCSRCLSDVSTRRWLDLFTVIPIEGRP